MICAANGWVIPEHGPAVCREHRIQGTNVAVTTHRYDGASKLRFESGKH